MVGIINALTEPGGCISCHGPAPVVQSLDPHHQNERLDALAVHEHAVGLQPVLHAPGAQEWALDVDRIEPLHELYVVVEDRERVLVIRA